MIEVVFYKQNSVYKGFSISGHAGFASKGNDIVCASVTSAVQLTINGICEILKVMADVKVLDNQIVINLSNCNKGEIEKAQAFFKAFYLHLDLLSQDYMGTLNLINLEV